MDFLGLTSSQWLDLGLSALIVVGAAVAGRLLASLVLDRGISRLTGRTHTTLDDVILAAIRPPVLGLIVVLGLELAVERLNFISTSGDVWLDDLFFALYLSVGFVFAWRLLSRLMIWYGKELATRTETSLDEQMMPFFRRVALMILTVIVLVMLLGHFDIDVSAFVTTLGIGSLAIALAAQATLADTFSGFVIMIDRPFRIGDRIEIQELGTWGDVIDVGLRSSRIRTRDNRMVIVPNSVIGKSLIVNHSYPNIHYRIQVHIGVAYGSDLEYTRQTMIDAVRTVDGVQPDRPVEALFLEFGDSALVFRLRWWIESYIDTRRMFDKVNTAVYHALAEAGIELPFPQQDVHHKIDPDDVARIAEALRG